MKALTVFLLLIAHVHAGRHHDKHLSRPKPLRDDVTRDLIICYTKGLCRP
jgi:hypothetical protein